MTQQPQPVVSPDGRWWWDGTYWRPVSSGYAAPEPVPVPLTPGPNRGPGPGPQQRKPRGRKVVYVVVASVAAFLLLVGSALGTGAWYLTRGNPSDLASFQIGFHSSFDWPWASSFDVTQVNGQTTMVFRVHLRRSERTDGQALLPQAQALQGIVNHYAPDFDGPVEIQFRQSRQVVNSITFGAHDSLSADGFSSP